MTAWLKVLSIVWLHLNSVSEYMTYLRSRRFIAPAEGSNEALPIISSSCLFIQQRQLISLLYCQWDCVVRSLALVNEPHILIWSGIFFPTDNNCVFFLSSFFFLNSFLKKLPYFCLVGSRATPLHYTLNVYKVEHFTQFCPTYSFNSNSERIQIQTKCQ